MCVTLCNATGCHERDDMSKQARPALSELENRVLQIVWEHGTATADEVRIALEPEQSLKDSTIRTILRRLEEKGYASHTIEGRTYRYRATAPPEAVAAGAVRKVIDQFCQGSVENLLVGMVESAVITPQKLAQLAQKIADSKQRSSSKKTRR
jgi:BlaI family transcriptional regulator, penicillinase repressor